ncbi:putative ABC transport system permease protein [Geoalkalibacter ferrihydriticus]|uniref:ABC transporter n=2 Tax=Geoalkalibacter ferrihydriticus TaxID=392333 RepID=A0A0C2DV10_9BACT|nr:ABC transporter permease [Geoalkalibacter ferrihydriticus]KIH77264.1 ABC transporter [Geoalkalibacter ferrihydriticus DSM 17813]SDM22578.1 putative ABC transport system permease protein [Geoalkalibacter ferrihydriticus]
MSIIDISIWRLIAGYSLLAAPLGIILWMRLPLLGETLSAVVRMTLQLLFVGFYLQVIFDLDNAWLTGAWVMVMILVADLSIARGCRLRMSRLAGGLFWALSAGTFIPLAFFVVVVLGGTEALSAQYVIPIGGMILGNCLRADIIGIRAFYESLQENEKAYLLSLAQGATLKEALAPFMRESLQAALAPTIATIATIGLVSLPGMMTGVILGGGDPMTAIKYQIAIMIAIYAGTAITVLLAIRLTARRNFTPQGTLDRGLFPEEQT